MDGTTRTGEAAITVIGVSDDSDSTDPDELFELRVKRNEDGSVRLDAEINDDRGRVNFIADIPIEDLAAFCRSVIAMAGESVAWTTVQGGEDADVESAIMAKAVES